MQIVLEGEYWLTASVEGKLTRFVKDKVLLLTMMDERWRSFEAYFVIWWKFLMGKFQFFWKVFGLITPEGIEICFWQVK